MSGLIDKIVTMGGHEPRQVARTVILIFIFGYATGKITKSILNRGVRGTLMIIAFYLYKQYKGERGMAQQMLEIKAGMRKQFVGPLKKMQARQYDDPGKLVNKQDFENPNLKMPVKAVASKELLRVMAEWAALETGDWRGDKHIPSGAIYHGGKGLEKIMGKAYTMNLWSNPLHPEIHPFIRKMETEIISMTVTLFNGGKIAKKGGKCGLVTSGGTESIMVCIRAYKNWAREVKGIECPELVIPETAHAAFLKACEGWGIKAVLVPVNRDTWTMTAAVARKYINSNTIAMVGSAVQYAQGVMDPIPELSKLAVEKQIGLHVDSCLGSYLLPTLRNLGFPIPFTDFQLPGVTTISCDTHKFGYSVKGTSVAMFQTEELRRHAYWTYPDCPIGMYATATIAGSRPGGLVAATWACIMSLGEEGYQEAAKSIMRATKTIVEAIDDTEGIRVMGDPPMSVIGFESTDSSLPIYAVSDAMSKRGWALNNCQRPLCTHICVTVNNMSRADKFARDIKEAVEDVRENPDSFQQTSAVVYGTLVEVPDASFKSEALCAYMDVCMEAE